MAGRSTAGRGGTRRNAGEAAAIELGLELKFGDEGLALMPQVRAIQELQPLRLLRETVRTAQSLAQVQEVLEQVQNGRG